MDRFTCAEGRLLIFRISFVIMRPSFVGFDGLLKLFYANVLGTKSLYWLNEI